MNSPIPSHQKRSWETFWLALAALGAMIAAGIACWTTLDAKKNAEENLAQQLAISQGNVMSTLMDEYFTIRRDATKDWRPESPDERIKQIYGERVYGLYLKEYHLYQREMIPRHVYELWLRNLKREINNKDESLRPRPVLKIDEKNNEDFDSFLREVLSSEEGKIPELVSRIPKRRD
jgi:hypothetical protein